MKANVCAIYDTKLKAYAAPFCVRNIAVAARYFASKIKDDKDDLSQFPQDFNVVHLADFDDETGTFENVQPTVILTGIQAKDL